MSDEADLYLIWSHEHGRWWGPGGRGYVQGVADAGRYNRRQALDIATKAIPGFGSREGKLPELPVRLEDVQFMQARHHGTYPGLGREPWE